jgi:O-antigen/teichoic acid export membrane protein
MLVAGLAAFSIKRNLLYFIPHHPADTKQYVGHTNWMILASTLIACLLLWIFREQIRSQTSFDFVPVLALYVLFSVNADVLESYWIATKRPKLVFLTSTGRIIARLGTVIGAAILTRSVEKILWAIVAMEAARVIVVFAILMRLDLLSRSLSWPVLWEQLRFSVPLGVSSSVFLVNRYAGQIIISSQLGVVALAIYAIGSYQVPVLNIVRGALGDAIFPDMVREASRKSGDSLRLWKRSNVAYTSIVFPCFVWLLWYADILIPLVFTEQYVESVPIFRILLFVMLTQCFGFSSTLRAVARTGTLLIGNFILLSVNLSFIYIYFTFYPDAALYGPAVGTVMGFTMQQIFLGWHTLRAYEIELPQLMKWRSLLKIVLSAAAGCLFLTAGELIPLHDVIRMTIFSVFFAGAYYLLIRRAGLEEIEILHDRLSRRLRFSR